MYWFITRTSGSQAVVEPTPEPAKGGKSKKRKWAVEIDGKLYIVDSIKEAEALVQEFQLKLDAANLSTDKPKKKKIKAVLRPNATDLLSKKEIFIEAKQEFNLPRYRESIDLTQMIEKRRLKKQEEILLLLL